MALCTEWALQLTRIAACRFLAGLADNYGNFAFFPPAFVLASVLSTDDSAHTAHTLHFLLQGISTFQLWDLLKALVKEEVFAFPEAALGP